MVDKDLLFISEHERAAAENWLKRARPDSGPVLKVRARAIQDLGARTGYFPLAYPAAMALIVGVSERGTDASAVLLWGLLGILSLSVIIRIHSGRKLAGEATYATNRWLRSYVLAGCASFLSWGVMVALMMPPFGSTQGLELAVLASIAVTAGAFGVMTVERTLWECFLLTLWGPVVAGTVFAMQAGAQDAVVLLTLELLFLTVLLLQGRVIVRQYVSSVVTQMKLELALDKIERQRGDIDEHRTQLRHMVHHSRKVTYYDVLTNLPNRAQFLKQLEDAIRQAAGTDARLALVYMDIDGFKDVNDSLGHQTGDTLLHMVAHRLGRMVRMSDFAARVGGDEFCVLVREMGDDFGLEQFADRCLQTIGKPLMLGNTTLHPGISIGIARFPEDGGNSQDLLKAADCAMYAAKHAGRHQYAFFQSEMSQEAEQRLILEQELRHALERDQFELHFQPQIRLHDGSRYGLEALLRWRHPVKGLIGPDVFIPALERLGLIQRVGEWVLRESVRHAVAWHAHAAPPVSMSVNVSPLQLERGDFPARVQAIIKEFGIAPALLVLELTETALQTGTDTVRRLEELRELGVRIAIDDFGTGYSSLGSLKHLPVDTLKIDRMFVRDILVNPQDALLMGSIIELAHAFNYTVIAEGVESEEQVARLAGYGCNIVQGYYFSKPVPAREVTDILRKKFPVLSSPRVANPEQLIGSTA